MADPAVPGPGWLVAGATAIVTALWTALRASTARELAFVKGELKVEREERERDRAAFAEANAKLGARYDALARLYERVCVQAATVATAAGDSYRDAMPTDVRDLAELMAKSTPPGRHAPPRDVRVVEVDGRGVSARPTLPAPPRPRGR